MIKLTTILLLFSSVIYSQTTVYDNTTLLTARDIGNIIKTYRKPGTDTIFALKVFGTDTSREARFVISDATTTMAKVAGLVLALEGKASLVHSHVYADISNPPTIPTNTNQLTNGAGFITGINSGNVTTALGFTPANTSHTHTDLLNDDPDFSAYQLLGSPFKAQTVGVPIQLANTSSNLTDGQIRWVAVYLAKAATLTGIRTYVRVLGSYTGDNNNRIGLYSYSGGTLTQVAASANSSTLWTSAANAFQTIAFSSTYAASAGIYYVAVLYNNSAQTTAPALASGTALNNLAMATLAFTNSAKLYGTSNGTDLPSSIAMSAITATTVTTWAALY